MQVYQINRIYEYYFCHFANIYQASPKVNVVCCSLNVNGHEDKY